MRALLLSSLVASSFSTAACRSVPAALEPGLHLPGAAAALGGDERWSLGARGGAWLGDGKPANDIPTYGLVARYRIAPNWWLGLELDFSDYDFEKPAEVVGLKQDPTLGAIDANAKATTLLALLERPYRVSERSEWFWSAGLGISSLDVDDASGPLQGGGTFMVETDADTEILASVGGGYRWWFARGWALEATVRINEHFADWQLEDTVSGAEGDIGNYLTWSFLLGLHYAW